MAGPILNFHPSTFTQLDDGFLLVFTDEENYQQYFVSYEYAVSRHVGEFCKRQNCRHHIMLYSSKSWRFMLEKLRSFNGAYMKVDASYHSSNTLSLYEMRGAVFNSLAEAVRHNMDKNHMNDIRGFLERN
jgi:hypothetical protein